MLQNGLIVNLTYYAKRTLPVKIIKSQLLTDYDRLKLKLTEKEILVRYQAYLLRYMFEGVMVSAKWS